NKKITSITAYDYSMAGIINDTDIDIILVGDSLGNVILGHKDTIAVTLNDMIHHARSVVKGAPDKLIIVDMPFMSISMGLEKSLENVMNVMQQTGAHGVKIEGGRENIALIKMLKTAGVPVMGHLGLTPQSYLRLGGYKTQGNTEHSATEIFNDAKELEEAGVFSIVLECVNEELAKKITKELKIPTIGIGSGNSTDGQILVINDLLGFTKNRVPSFVKPKLNLYEDIKKAVNDFARDVRGN
ncbi:MAG: 3-methyl-2-oxobutanoate hydroxymethyltransferase, partial [Proteobacteria bacterium]|nr:3-methyl-2-oxobutanoate hydroxymethyltransferase [Pseudomonadota bacterium]